MDYVQKSLRILFATTLLITSLGMYASNKINADLALINGAIWTVNPSQPKAQALAIKGNKILFVGSSLDVKQYIGKSTKTVDLKGKMVIPGFIDSHAHFLEGGLSLFDVQLRSAKSKKEFISKIAEKASHLEKGAWILNGNWDHQQFHPAELPRKEWIDEVTKNNPVCVNRIDGHMVLANSKALQIAGITKDTASPKGGEIVKDPITNEPTGILKDAAVKLLKRSVPEPNDEEKTMAAKAAIKHAHSLGITSVHQMAYVTNFEIYRTYLKLLQQNALPIRLSVYLPITEIDKILNKTHTPSPDRTLLKIAGVKGFVDGSLGSSTALFYQAYKDNPESRGTLFPDMIPKEKMKNRLILADKAGLQVAIHAIGDKAIHLLLDLFNDIIQQQGKKERRWRIEHVQHVVASDIQKMKQLNIIASVQPYHLIDDSRWIETKLGKERSKLAYQLRGLQKAGVKLACGSDWTVAPLSPIQGIYAAVTRRSTDNTNPNGWLPEQKISLENAIECYTLNAAYADFSDKQKGSIEVGKLADLVILDKNLFEIAPENIRSVQVSMTVFNGKIVYDMFQQ